MSLVTTQMQLNMKFLETFVLEYFKESFPEIREIQVYEEKSVFDPPGTAPGVILLEFFVRLIDESNTAKVEESKAKIENPDGFVNWIKNGIGTQFLLAVPGYAGEVHLYDEGPDVSIMLKKVKKTDYWELTVRIFIVEVAKRKAA